MATERTAVAGRRPAPHPKGRPFTLPAVLTIALVAIGLAALLPLLQSSRATTIGYNISQLERQRDGWEARTHELEAEIASLGALDRIEREARQRLDMRAPEERLYLTVDVPSPQSQPIPARFLPAKEESTREEQPWWQSFLDWLPLP